MFNVIQFPRRNFVYLASLSFDIFGEDSEGYDPLHVRNYLGVSVRGTLSLSPLFCFVFVFFAKYSPSHDCETRATPVFLIDVFVTGLVALGAWTREAHYEI